MALQSSGAISISQIKTELGSSSNSLRTLSAAAGKSTPDAMSEFYGYSAYTPPSYLSGANSISGAGTAASPYTVNVYMNPNYFYWAGDLQQYYSYLYNRYVEREFSNCSQPEEMFKNFFIQSASSAYNWNYLKFNNQHSGAQKMYVKFVSSNINFNSQGYTGFFFDSNEANFDYNVQNPTGNVWTSTVVNTTQSGDNFTKSAGTTLNLFAGFTQWSLEANSFGSYGCDNPDDEYHWEVYLDIPSAYYKITVSSFIIQVWFVPV